MRQLCLSDSGSLTGVLWAGADELVVTDAMTSSDLSALAVLQLHSAKAEVLARATKLAQAITAIRMGHLRLRLVTQMR